MHGSLLVGVGDGGLRFEIEVFLAADGKGAIKHVRRGSKRCACVAGFDDALRADETSGGHGFVDREYRRKWRDLGAEELAGMGGGSSRVSATMRARGSPTKRISSWARRCSSCRMGPKELWPGMSRRGDDAENARGPWRATSVWRAWRRPWGIPLPKTSTKASSRRGGMSSMKGVVPGGMGGGVVVGDVLTERGHEIPEVEPQRTQSTQRRAKKTGRRHDANKHRQKKIRERGRRWGRRRRRNERGCFRRGAGGSRRSRGRRRGGGFRRGQFGRR